MKSRGRRSEILAVDDQIPRERQTNVLSKRIPLSLLKDNAFRVGCSGCCGGCQQKISRSALNTMRLPFRQLLVLEIFYRASANPEPKS